MKALNDLKKLSAAFSIVFATLMVADDANLSTQEKLHEANATVIFDDQQMSEKEQKASTGSLDRYLSDLKRQQFGYEYEKNDQESSKLRDSWISPVMLQYSISRSNPYNRDSESQSAAIVMDQPIFQSGGIIYGVKFANASRDFANYSIDQQKRIMIKQTIDLLMQVKQSKLAMDKQQLQIANSSINLEQQREQYLNGQLDSGFLNNAIIETNIVKQAMFDLETRNEQLIAQFKKLSDLDPKTAKIPFLA
nr:TolC family protein [Helicobacteraceae bacterium]